MWRHGYVEVDLHRAQASFDDAHVGDIEERVFVNVHKRREADRPLVQKGVPVIAVGDVPPDVEIGWSALRALSR